MTLYVSKGSIGLSTFTPFNDNGSSVSSKWQVYLTTKIMSKGYRGKPNIWHFKVNKEKYLSTVFLRNSFAFIFEKALSENEKYGHGGMLEDVKT